MVSLEGKKSAAETGNGSTGCPVQHTPASTANAKEAKGAVASAPGSPPVAQGSTNAGVSSDGLWRRIATWIPFGGSPNEIVSRVGDNDGDNGHSRRTVGGTATGANVAGGGCPVETSNGPSSASASSPTSTASVESSSSGCPVQHDSATSFPSGGALLKLLTGGSVTEEGDGGAAGEKGEPAYNALNNEYVYGQEEFPGQEMPLSTLRQRSSIPKADYNPSHQPKGADKTWVYPSEQQYYNAIKRKGYKASATDMPSTLAIHNAVNEKGWEMVKEWERERAVGKASPSSLGAGGGSGSSSGGGEGDDIEIKLLRFTGRPQDMSPKAWINTYLLGYRPPFDRHDWVVKRTDGTEARYVIDFYAGKVPPGSEIPVAMHLDVRPAIDSFEAVVDRTRIFYTKEVQPYFSRVLDRFRSDPGSSGPSGEDAPPPPPSLAR